MKENVIKNYFKHSFEELTKVTWPTKNQAVKLTIVVLIFCIVFAVCLSVVDYGLEQLHTLMIEKINVQQTVDPVDVTATAETSGGQPITVTPVTTTPAN